MSEHAGWFDIVALAPQGDVRSTRVHAASAAEATRHLQAQGLRVLACTPARADRRAPAAQRSRLDVAQFAQELAALLDAGLGMLAALETLGSRNRSPHLRALFGRLARAVSDGRTLSQALAREPADFPELLVAAVAASEETGDLPSALRRFGDNQAELRALRARLLGAAIYPAILLAVGAAVVVFLLAVVVPRFALLIERAPNELPFASRLLLGAGAFLAEHPWPFAALAAALVAAAVAVIVRAHRNGWQVPGLQRAWLIGPLIRLFRQAQFFRTTAMLVGGGIPALRAFSLAAGLLTPEDRHALQGACARIAQGHALGDALAGCGIADVVAHRMLEVAGRTGRLAEALGRIAAFQEQQLAGTLDVVARLLEPAMMVFIGLVIGGIVVLMYLPIFELAAGLQ